MSPQQLAEAVARHLYERDKTSHALGITLAEIRPGYARVTMHVRADMLNSHGLLHGGMTFTLADTAFAYACNSKNDATVASGCDILYPAPGREGDVLTAEAEERHLVGRTGLYDVTVTNQEGAIVGLFRGRSHRVQGTIVDGDNG